MALANMRFKDQNWSHFGESSKTDGKREKKRKRKRKKMEEPRSSKKVWKLTLIMNSMRFDMDLWVCMMIILSLNLGF